VSRVAVVGAGAMGGLWAGLIGSAGHEVTIVDPSVELIEAVQVHGLRVSEPDGAVRATHPQAVREAGDAGPSDVVFVFVKGPHTPAVAERVHALMHPGTIVATLQNGWGNADVLAERVPPERIVIGVTFHSATIESPGRIHHGGSGPSTIGPYLDAGGADGAEQVAMIMREAGLECTVSADVKTAVWMKLVHNSACLPVSALTGLLTPQLVEPGPWRDLIDELAREAVVVARGLGYDIDADERIEHIHRVLGSAGAGVPSMLADVRARRATEIETINGAVARESRAQGRTAPLHEAMVALVHGVERAWRDS
jgi:2-dehydropantoate 2-reductase